MSTLSRNLTADYLKHSPIFRDWVRYEARVPKTHVDGVIASFVHMILFGETNGNYLSSIRLMVGYSPFTDTIDLTTQHEMLGEHVFTLPSIDILNFTGDYQMNLKEEPSHGDQTFIEI